MKDAHSTAREILRYLFSQRNKTPTLPQIPELNSNSITAYVRRKTVEYSHGEYYPPVAFRYRVDILGVGADNLGFSEVSGLETKWGTSEIKEGGENNFVHRVPERITYENLTLKRGFHHLGSPLVEWCRRALSSGINQKIETHTISVKLLNETGLPTAVWEFVKAYPVRWKAADLSSTDDSNVLIEEIEFSYQKINRL